MRGTDVIVNTPVERAALERMLAEYAPLREAPLCPELRVFYAHSLVDIWSAAERLAGQTLPAPFWAYPWAGGCALARVILDHAEWVRDKRVLDFGAGGGIASIAAALAGANVVANDIDAWALLVCRIAADAHQLPIDTLHADICADTAIVEDYDVVLCSDLCYERSETARQLAVLEHAHKNGALVLVADAKRTYFEPGEMTLIAEFDVPVPKDLEGNELRRACVFRR